MDKCNHHTDSGMTFPTALKTLGVCCSFCVMWILMVEDLAMVTDHNYQAAIFQKKSPIWVEIQHPPHPQNSLVTKPTSPWLSFTYDTQSSWTRWNTNFQKNGWSQHISTIFRLSWWCSLELWALCRKAMHALFLSHLGRKSRLRVPSNMTFSKRGTPRSPMVFLMGNRNRRIHI